MIPGEIADYRALARRKLPRFLFEYIDGGAGAQTTLRHNVSDFEKVKLRQRVMRDVSKLDLTTTLFGQQLSMPLALAPVGLSGLYGRRGECQAAKAAEEAGIRMSLSTLSLCGVEEVARASSTPIWFQLYMIKDRGFMREMLARARESGCSLLLFTVDLPVAGARWADARTGLANGHLPAAQWQRMKAMAARPGWLWDVGLMGRPHDFGNVALAMGKGGVREFWRWVGASFDTTVTWKDMDFVREHWDRPMVIKGVLDPDDARASVAAGAEGIVVSNHGGRQLDGVSSTIAALPRIVDAVGDKTTVLLDGGVRCGTDVVRALALGAKGVLIGRPWAYALAARGGAGVSAMLEQFRKEIGITLALAGVPDVKALGRDALDLG
ncbi:MAG TPA: L-lactate dehydrogenase [Caulobacteraceae bacterium]